MALSNWDTLSINKDGTTARGEFISPLGVVVEFYKNWLYIRDLQAWRESLGWSKSYVGEILEGNMKYQDVEVIATRGPQEGIYAIVRSGYGEDLKMVVGCGVYGYMYPPTECGHDINEVGSVSSYNSKKEFESFCRECGSKIEDAEFVGVLPESVKFLKEFVLKQSCDWYDEQQKLKCEYQQIAQKLDKAVRFNQGDAYFANHMGTDFPDTPVGAVDEPVITAFFGKG